MCAEKPPNTCTDLSTLQWPLSQWRNDSLTFDQARWVDLGWMPGAHQNCSMHPIFSWTGEKKYTERFVVNIRTERDHSLITVMDETDWTLENLCIAHWIREGKKNNQNWKRFPPTPPFFLGSTSFKIFSLSSSSAVQEGGDWELWSVHHRLSLIVFPYWGGEDFSHYSPAPAWGLSHTRWFSTDFSIIRFFPMGCSFSLTAPTWSTPSGGCSTSGTKGSSMGLLQGHRCCHQTCLALLQWRESQETVRSLLQHSLPTESSLPQAPPAPT